MRFIKIIIFLVYYFISFNAQSSDSLLNWKSEPSSGLRKIRLSTAKKYMISTSNILASEAGEEILSKGGNAIDAMIAAELVLNVVEPQSSGIGGGGFLLYFDKETKKSIYFNGRETAPIKANKNMFLDQNGNPKNFNSVVEGGLSVGTPGLLKMMKEAHDKYGKIPWFELFIPAIDLAQNGFIVDSRLHSLASYISYIRNFDETKNLYTKTNGDAQEIGRVIKNPQMAETLKTIAREGIEPFYNGKIGKNIVKKIKNSPINPGILELEDLKNYRVKTGDLICTNYRKKYKICSMTIPSSGGVTLLQILGILENFNLKKYKPNSTKAIHLITEATRLAYADRNEYVSDSVDVPIKEMLDKNYLKNRSKLINKKRSDKEYKAGIFTNYHNKEDVASSYKLNEEPPSTTHISIIDSDGNAVAMTSSIEYYFGSALTVDGFLLNNHMTDFSFVPEINGKKVANCIEPGKQPRSSMSPTFVFDKNDNLILIVGSPGGPRIIQHVLKTIIANLDWKLDIQSSVALPNFIALNNILELEKNTKITRLEKSLRQMGHNTKIVEITSGIHAIAINKNKISGGADPRRNGNAIGK